MSELSTAEPVRVAQPVFTFWASITSPVATRATKPPTWGHAWDWLKARGREPFLGPDRQPGWSAADFDPRRRAKKHVREVVALVLDFDDGVASLDEVHERWGAYYGAMYATKSYRDDSPALRVVLPLSRAVTAQEYELVWSVAYEIDARLDRACKDPSRYWYDPSHRQDGGPPVFVRLEGAPIDVDAWLARAAQNRRPTRADDATTPTSERSHLRVVRERDQHAAYARSALERECAAVAYAGEGERNSQLNRSAFALAQLAAAGALDGSEAASALADAARQTGLEDSEIHRTISNGFSAGAKQPRKLPPPKARTTMRSRISTPDVSDAPSTESDGHNPGEVSAAKTTGRVRLSVQISEQLERVVDATVAALPADPDLYQRDGRLVRLVRVALPDAERERMAVGTPQIRAVTIATMRERLTRVVAFEKWDGRSESFKPCLPTDHVVTAVVDRGEWPGVRPLVGVIETPSMRPDGTVIDEPGYDAATGYIYAPSREYPAVPDQPTREDARAALKALAEPWTDFPVSSEAERCVPIAALLTLVARPAIRGACPAFLFDASTRGSGKSLMARAVTTLAQGREAALMSWPTAGEELEKVLGAYALRGASVIAFDNVASEFGGASLDKVLTCSDRVELRILGKSETPALAWRAVVLAGGNNLTIGGDTTRRVLLCRLEPMCERPEERTGYRIPDLAEWCVEYHPRIVAAALTLLRAYVCDGRPSQGLAGWGSFEAWRDLIGNALVWAGGEDVTKTRPTLSGDEDPVTAALRVLLAHLPSLAGKAGITASALIGKLYSPERMKGFDSKGNPVQPDGYDELRAALETLAPPPRAGAAPVAQKLGNAFGKARGRVIGGASLVIEKDAHGTKVWAVRQHDRGAEPKRPKDSSNPRGATETPGWTGWTGGTVSNRGVETCNHNSGVSTQSLENGPKAVPPVPPVQPVEVLDDPEGAVEGLAQYEGMFADA